MRTLVLLSLMATSLVSAGCLHPEGIAAHDVVGTTEPAVFHRTIVTPHLETPIDPNRNLLWCSTFQLAWNETCRQAGGPLEIIDAPPMVAVLNKRAASREDIDEASCITAAGVGPKIIERIRRQFERKFPNRPVPRVLPPAENVPPGGWVAFACLYKDLPFERPFRRFPRAVRFVDGLVASFVLGGPPPDLKLSPDGFPDEKQLREHRWRDEKIAEQVAVFDYKNPDDFIIEIKTKSKEDRLLLAKVTPEATLGHTVEAVRRRVEKSKPVNMDMDGDKLTVPVVDFDVTRKYRELIGKVLVQSGKPIVEAIQTIRFSLDEKGSRLESGVFIESWGERMRPPYRMFFDKPFLILLERRGAKRPYFALWVANSELLLPMALPPKEPEPEEDFLNDPFGTGNFDPNDPFGGAFENIE